MWRATGSPRLKYLSAGENQKMNTEATTKPITVASATVGFHVARITAMIAGPMVKLI